MENVISNSPTTTDNFIVCSEMTEQVISVPIEEKLIFKKKTIEYINQCWRDCRNDYPYYSTVCIHAIKFAKHLGILNWEEGNRWEEKIKECPGHDDEGGRVWCAYCGDAPFDAIGIRLNGYGISCQESGI